MYSLQTLSRKVKAKLLRLVYDEQWVIGARPRCDSRLPTDVSGCILLEPPEGVHYADPFVIQRNSKTCIFFESWSEGETKGRIQVVTLDSFGRWSPPEPALERPYHLSYPQVFSWRGDVYMLPETRHNCTIELYRATNFPYAWERIAVLMENVDAVDATLFEQRGQWWMFTAGLGDAADRSRRLSIFHASSPLGPWRSHSANPVINNLRTARPAGNLFVLGEQLIRPAQDCRSRYGYAISWNRVDLLTEDAYHETLIASLNPSSTKDWTATHTFNQGGNWQVFDGKRLAHRLHSNSLPSVPHQSL